MINPELHKKPVALDRVTHRNLRLRTELSNLQAAAGLNAFFITVAEFGDICKEYPILFLRAGADDKGQPQIAPVAVFGLARGENLFIEGDAPAVSWSARYVPAMLRAYPFTMGLIEKDQWALAIDESWAGWSTSEGQVLFDEQGEGTPFLKDLRGFVERVEVDAERTRQIGIKLMAMNLLQDKRFDAKLPDGSSLTVDGFMGVDEKRFTELSEAEVVELHRSGLLGLLQAHLISLGNMSALLERRVKRGASTPA